MWHRAVEWVTHKIVMMIAILFYLGCGYILLLLFAGVQPRIIG